MRKTVMIQANKNCTSKEADEKRGLIYYRGVAGNWVGGGSFKPRPRFGGVFFARSATKRFGLNLLLRLRAIPYLSRHV
jgi:hypothetical protein